jgi:alpha-N-arabinofuranosidase
MYEFDIKTMKVIGEEKLLVNGGTDINKKPIWIEGPHLFKKDGWYYLICAEGGTGYNHSEVVFRTKSLKEPFVSFNRNPILTQRHLDPGRKNPVTTTGHADFVETPDGKWYAVFLGCRPYEGDYYNTGRETFMLPVKWEDGWPIILDGNDEVKAKNPVPFPQPNNKEKNEFNRNPFFRDDFTTDNLNNRYAFLRNPAEGLYHLNKGKLFLPLKAATVSGKENPAFIGFRQPNLIGFATTELEFTAASENEKAGLIIFQSENHYYFLCKSLQNGQPVVQLFKGPGKQNAGVLPILLASQPLIKNKKLYLKIEAQGDTYSFYYANKKNKWKLLKDSVDGKFLSTKDAGGFVGSMFAMYASSGGKTSPSIAAYDWFEYKGSDDMYK